MDSPARSQAYCKQRFMPLMSPRQSPLSFKITTVVLFENWVSVLSISAVTHASAPMPGEWVGAAEPQRRDSRLRRRAATVPAEREIVAYCRGPYCVFADEAVALLRAHGLRAHRYTEGFPEWAAAVLPVAVDEPDVTASGQLARLQGQGAGNARPTHHA